MPESERRYANTHEWVMLEDRTATVGISQFAVDQLGDVVYVEVGAAGRDISAGEALGDIESVKAVSQIYAPVSGKVIEVNGQLADHPELVNDSPLDSGWMVKLSDVNEQEVSTLLDEAAYQTFLESQK
jgi:glycine cleavage system H protein